MIKVSLRLSLVIRLLGKRFAPTRLRTLAQLAILALLLSPGASSAQVSVALWLDSKGKIDPAINPMTEQIGPTQLVLESESIVRFFHLQACRLVEIKGGSIDIGPLSFHVSQGGKVITDEKRSCPARVRLVEPGAGSQTAAGLVLRGSSQDGTQIHRYPASPAFVLVGKSASRVVMAEIIPADQVAAKIRTVLTLTQNRTIWPISQAPLTADAEYTLRLLDSDEAEVGRLAFRVTSDNTAGQEFDVLRID